MFKQLIILKLLFLVSYVANAQTKVHTSQELQEVLAQNKDVGVVLLDGDYFQVNTSIVHMGGKILPYGKRKPVLLGHVQTVNKKEDTKVYGGYWTTQIKGNGAVDYFFFDENLENIERVKLVDGKEYMYLKVSDLQFIDKSTRTVKIEVPSGYTSLLNRNEVELKNSMLKVAYWFVQINICNLKSDNNYLYGQIDNTYNYNLLNVHPNATIQVGFYNFPCSDGGIFLDGNDLLHVPDKYTAAMVGNSPNILTLCGDRMLSIEGVTFVGSMNPIVIKGANKHIKNCYFKNCGYGVYCDYGVTNRLSKCSVSNCHFENLYNNNAITFVGCDDVVISYNNIHNTGVINKGGSVIRVGGDKFQVNHNIIRCYSYIAINAAMTRSHDAARMTGYIRDNVIDNEENWGRSDRQLTDGGGIYVLTHTDGLVIENNIVRNIGYEGCELWGIYLDDGAYNCTVRHNLVYNLWPGQYVATARYVDECERSCMNNVFEDNIFLGPCKIAGNKKGYGNKTIIRGNYITGDLDTQGDEYVQLEGNKFVTSTVGKDGRITFGKGDRIKKFGFTRKIKKLIKR